MSPKTLNWGLLSTARINRALIPPLQSTKRNKLTAVASRSQARAEEYARQWNIPGAYGSYEEMLADPDIDVEAGISKGDMVWMNVYQDPDGEFVTQVLLDKPLFLPIVQHSDGSN